VTVRGSDGKTTISDLIATTAVVNGGTMDNIAIGSTTKSTGGFTSLAVAGSLTGTEKMTVTGDASVTGTMKMTAANINGGVQIAGSVISKVGTVSSDANQNINISPGGTGECIVSSSFTASNVKISGATIKSTSSNQDITIQPDGTGSIVMARPVQLQTSYVACAEAKRGTFYFQAQIAGGDILYICMLKADGTYGYVQAATG
jgi:hypothetical protein